MAEQATQQTATKLPKHRSPAYPFISLKTALEKARAFYGPQTRHPAPLSTAMGIWKFGAKSSGGMQTISALKQFELLAEEEVNNTRQVKLTDVALRIIQDERETSPERDAEIKRLALLPKIYSEMWTKWGATLPADGTVKFFLVNEKKYNEAAFTDLFIGYKDTIKFAKLVESDKTPPAEGGSKDKPDGGIKTPPPHTQPPPARGAKIMEGERELTTGLLSKNASFRLIVSGEVGVKEIERLIAKLQLDKEILADPDGDDSPSE